LIDSFIFIAVDNVSEADLSQNVMADVSDGNLSQKAEANSGGGSDEEVNDDDADIWLKVDNTPPAKSKFSSNEVPMYGYSLQRFLYDSNNLQVLSFSCS